MDRFFSFYLFGHHHSFELVLDLVHLFAVIFVNQIEHVVALTAFRQVVLVECRRIIILNIQVLRFIMIRRIIFHRIVYVCDFLKL